MNAVWTTTPLRRDEAAMLQACEAEIERGLEGFFSIGQALSEIRDAHLYRGRYKSWADYLKQRWQMSDRRARQHIAASEVVAVIGTMVPALIEARNHAGFKLVLPSNERQVRPLVSLPPEEQREVWREIIESAPTGPDGQPRVTGAHVKLHVEQRQKQFAPDVTRDSEPLKSPPTLDDTPPAKPSAMKPAATVLDAITTVAAALKSEDVKRACEAATAALGVLDKRWRGTSAENLTRSVERLQKALARDGQQKTLALCLELLLRAIAGGEK